MAEKKYYYLKLEQDYFNNKIIKALRKKPSGAEMCVVYLKMQLRYLHCEGYIQFNGLCDTMAEEIAMDIDEDVDVVKMTLIALTKWNCIEEVTHDTLYMNECQQRIGSVTDVATRVARHRAKNKEIASESVGTKAKMLQCNTDVTKGNDILEIELEKEIDKDINKYMDLVHDVVEYLNQVTGKRYSDTSKDTIKLIKARAKEKYTIEDFKQVIDYKSKEWLNTEMDKYLRPATLFSTNFGRYLEDSKQPVKTIKKKVQKDVELPDWYDNYKNREEDKADDHISTDGFAYFKGE